MNDFQYRLQRRFSDDQFLELALSIGVVTLLTALVFYAYLGTFSRYGSDDYCLSAFFKQDNILRAMVFRYFNASSRYTNIVFIGLADKIFGWYNVAILPAFMLAMFVLGLYLLLKEINGMVHWGWSRLMLFFLALLVAYFSITQAPDLYETLYWRAGMTSHLAPVVLIPFFGTFLLRQLRNARNRPPPWVLAACFVIPFLLGGLSEPPTAVMITVLGLAICAVLWWGDAKYRRAVVSILLWSLIGALMALMVMALAPANSIRMRTPPPGLAELIFRIVYYPVVFILDTFRTLPTPTLVSVVVPAIFFYVKYVHPSQEGISNQAQKRLLILMMLVLALGYLLIAASFAPSAYGQSYPAPRARFFGRVLMTIALMIDGALLGILLSQARTFQAVPLRGFATIVLILLVIYPLRTAWKLFGEIPVYQQRAAAWDLRESEIRELKADGIQDLVVRFLPEEESQDLGDQTDFRLNRCAAILYEVNSIVAVPMEGE